MAASIQKSNQPTSTKARSRFQTFFYEMKRDITRNYELYLILAVPIALIIIFNYIPMLGVQIAFKDYSAKGGIWGSPWVGFKHFDKFFHSYQFVRVITNTITLSLYSLLVNFPIPILLALSLNICLNERFKKIVQMSTYAPHFISTVVMVGILNQFLGSEYGIINVFIRMLGMESIPFLGIPEWFSSIYVWSGVWQGMGWGSIIYISALAGIDPSLHEAAIVDGANRFKRILHIDIPGIKSTMIILLIMDFGKIMNVGFEKVFLMQNPVNQQYSEVISTYLYKVGLQAQIPDYSYSTAIGLFNSVINFIMVMIVNRISRKVSETSLW